MAIECLVLGAGQEVGKSCVVVTVGGKKIMFDCGMHMGCVDDPYPDFSRIFSSSSSSGFDSVLSCVIITHFHLDHVGALPFFTEVCGYNGPIYMTGDEGLYQKLPCLSVFGYTGKIDDSQYPTKALAPLMLEDYRKVMVERRGEKEQFTYEHIVKCMEKAIAVDIKQTVEVDKDLQICAYYAGHVLGAAMFYVKVGENTLVYTGDYNMTPDRHLGAAQIDYLRLDLLITESTYAATIRASKYPREREFLKIVHECVTRGGKVLIPTFAMGRAQELCLLLEDYWDRMNLKIPIYFSAGLTIQANMYYKMLISWTSQKIKDSHGKHNAFDFKHVRPFHRSMIAAPGPCVLFATPGMLTGGFSLEVFKHWAPSERNLVTIPGFCLAGTLGHKLMSGKASKVNLDNDTQIDVRCQIHQLAFSPHTDAKGIMDLVRFLSPRNVILVHGEKPSMEKLKGRIQSELGIQCYIPANNEFVKVQPSHTVKVNASRSFLRKYSTPNFDRMGAITRVLADGSSKFSEPILSQSQSEYFGDRSLAEGVLVMDKTKRARVVLEDEMPQLFGVEHKVKFCYCCPVDSRTLEEEESRHGLDSDWLHLLRLKLENLLNCQTTQEVPECISFGSLQIRLCKDDNCPFRRMEDAHPLGLNPSLFLCCSWLLVDEELVQKVLRSFRNLT